MKKNFFKKLSFVLVLAMVLSVFAPVGSAFAAKAPKLNTSKKYLLLDNEDRNEYDFNVSNVAKGATVRWLVGNEAVATVDKNGVVTAKGPGVTNVAAEVTPKGGKAVRARAKVVVYDNAVEVEVTDLPEADVKVGVEHDFDKAYVTEAGSTSKTSSKFKWSVEKDGEAVSEDVATIDLKGIFVAKEAGEYTIVVRAFQSNPKYKAWVNNNELDYVTAKAETTVKVVPSIVDVKQVNKDSFKVEFDSDMSKAELDKKATVARMIGDKEYTTGTEKIKSVSLDDTGKVATVTLYGNFVEESTYKFKFNNDEASFVAAKVGYREIAEIKFTEDPLVLILDKDVDLAKKVEALNADGVVLYTGTELVGNGLEFSYDDGKTYKLFVTPQGLAYVYEAGVTGTVTAKFERDEYNAETISYDKIKHEAIANVVSVKDAIVAGSISHKLTDAAITAGSDDVKKDDGWARSFTVQQGGSSLVINTRYKLDSNDAYILGEALSYESTNTDVVIIQGTNIYFASKGVATILVKKDNVIVDSFDVTVVDAQKLVTVTPDSALTVSLGNSNDPELKEERTFKFIAKDNLNKDLKGVKVAYTLKQSPEKDVVLANISAPNSNDKGEIVVTVNANGSTKGLYVYELEFEYNGGKVKHNISINVIDASDKTVARYEMTYDKEVDLKGVSSDIRNVDVDVFGLNAHGARVEKVTDVILALNGKDQKGPINAKKLDKGTYTISVKSSDGKKVLVSGALIIKDTTTKSFAVKSAVVEDNSIVEAINAAFSFKINDKDVDFESGDGFVIKSGKDTVTGTSLEAGDYFVEKVIIKRDGIEYEIAINKGLKIK